MRGDPLVVRRQACRTGALALGPLLLTAVAGGLAGCHHEPGAASSAGEQAALVQGTSPGDPRLRFVGRFDFGDPAHPRFAWPGSTVTTRFSGPSLRVRLKDSGYDELDVSIDGAPPRVVPVFSGKDDYELATGLGPGEHEVRIVKRSEARMGEIQLLGFTPPESTTAPAALVKRRIELVGDSITAGYGVLGTGVSCTGNLVAMEAEPSTYGALAARSLGADHVTIAWSGRTVEEMGGLFERTLPARADSRWDFARWTPDAVVINLGTNDFTRGDPGEAAFSRPYAALIRRVREVYPRAEIVCALGPMLTDTYPPGAHALSKARSYLVHLVESARAAGDAHISMVEFPSQDFANGIGCDYHPSVKTHRLMADQLAAALRARLGW